jgi:hypothetical protein
MKKLLFHKLRVCALVLLGLGAVSASVAVYSTAKSHRNAQGFTLYSTMTTAMGGTEAKTGSRVRYQRSDGSFKQITTYYRADGTVSKTDILLGQPNRGVFAVDERAKSLEFVSGLSANSIVLAESDLHAGHRNVVREEKLLGYRVLVARVGDGNERAGYTELYHAPELMGFQIKTVAVTPAATLTIEPTRIVAGEPAARDLEPPPYPVNYELYEEKIKTMEERGEVETARQMREILRIARS